MHNKAVARSGERLREILESYDVRGEQLIALGQIGLASFILLLHVIAHSAHGWKFINFWVFGALATLITSSLLRLFIVRHERVTEWPLDFLTIIDVTSIMALIGSYQLAYHHPSGGSLKASSITILYALVALRALRFSPRPILVSGVTAIVGWALMVLLSVILDGTEAITRNYTEYLSSYKILIGAEVEKIVAMAALTGFLAMATTQARKIIGEAAHIQDYAQALAESEQNVKNATIARLKAHKALRMLGKSEKLLRTQNERFNAVLENMSQGVAMFNSHKRLVICNDRYTKLYSLPMDLIKEGATLREILEYRIGSGFYHDSCDTFIQDWITATEKTYQQTKLQKMCDGRTISFVCVPLENGGWLETHEDVSEFRKIQEDFFYLAHHDVLTGLANRHMFRIQLEQALNGLKEGERLAIHVIDLDHFKNVNDTLGHPIGDKLLKAVTERLQEEVGDTGIIARMGGDEFALIQWAVNQTEDTADLARRIINTISRTYSIDDHQIIIGASIGIAFGPADGDRINTLMRNADLALYRAKENGRGSHCFFEAEMDAKMQTRRVLEIEMRGAIETGVFELHYQPLIDLESRELCGFEALLRWPDPEKGYVPLAEFIPLAEETGYIVPIGEWVLREACKTAASWPEHLRISVNLSPVQFRNSGLVQLVANALAASGLSPNRLELEITESVLMQDNTATLATLRQLKQLGVRVAMDDFGTGYSLLSYLQSLPFDKIKIDRSFVKELVSDSDALNLMRAVASMAKAMGIETTAEGVETQKQLELVRDEGYTQMQGYLVSQPLPAEQIEELFQLKSDTKQANGVQKQAVKTRTKLVKTG